MTLSQNTKILQDYIKNNSNIEKKSEKGISAIYQQLIDCITDHNHLYYISNSPIISDLEYDQLFDYIKKIEEYFPHMISWNSPTQWLIWQISEWFTKKNHEIALLSLENTYDAEDLKNRDSRIYRILEKQEKEDSIPNTIDYIIEPKFDWISVELIYKNWELMSAITRWDGKVWEEIILNALTIKWLNKLKIKDESTIHVRGEIMMPKSVFKKINKERESNWEQIFANTRNAAAWSIKLLDSSEVKKRWLICYVYDILIYNTSKTSDWINYNELNTNQWPFIHFSWDETYEILERYWLPTFPRRKKCNFISEVIDICNNTETKEYFENQDCDFDWLVVKVNNWNIRTILKETQHHPRRAVAYKFPAQQVSTQILSIDFQIGRTWIITPVANLSPTQLSWATISRTTLHNFDFVQNKDIKIGDYVWLQRSWEVIPYIVWVIKDKRNWSETTVNPPTKCPVCDSKIINEDIHYYCSNDNCPAQIKAKLEHFVSKNCMDIMWIGDSIVDILVDQKIISNIADLFQLTDPNNQILLQKFPWFGSKKVSEISNQLIQAKAKPLRRLLNWLGIWHVGKKTAIMIVDNLIKYYSLQDQELSPLKNLTKHITDPDFLSSIVGIWQKTVQEIIDFFNNKNNLEILKELEEFWINFNPIQYYKDQENLWIFEWLNNWSFSITWTFPISRETIVQNMQKQWRTFHENPKKDTKMILVGEQAWSKKAKAQELQIQIIQWRNNIIQEFPFLQNIINPDKSSNKFSNKPTSQHSLF